MNEHTDREFPCNNCGACCWYAGLHNLHREEGRADFSDLRCKPLDLDTKRCAIYATRPLICRVKDSVPEKEWDKLRATLCNNFHYLCFGSPIEPQENGDCKCEIPKDAVPRIVTPPDAVHKPE